MPRRKEHIVIAIPSGRGALPVPLADWIARLTATNHDPDSPYGFSLISCSYKQPFEYARNVLVGEFLKTDGDRMWFVDDDMVPGPHSIGLLKAEADIAIGAYVRAAGKEDQTISLDVLLFRDGQHADGREMFVSIPMSAEREFFDVASGGTGCMLIRRRVLEDPRMLLDGSYVDWRGKKKDHYNEAGDPGWAPPMFRTLRRPDGNTDLGEDHDFCRRARALGYAVQGHMLHGMDHQKTTTANMILRTIAREKVRTRQSIEEGQCAK